MCLKIYSIKEKVDDHNNLLKILKSYKSNKSILCTSKIFTIILWEKGGLVRW
jgi:hypothetical protein